MRFYAYLIIYTKDRELRIISIFYPKFHSLCIGSLQGEFHSALSMYELSLNSALTQNKWIPFQWKVSMKSTGWIETFQNLDKFQIFYISQILHQSHRSDRMVARKGQNTCFFISFLLKKRRRQFFLYVTNYETGLNKTYTICR